MFLRLFPVAFALICCHAAYSNPIESLKNQLNSITLKEQLKVIVDLPFDDVVNNSQQIIPLLHHYESLANKNGEYSSLAKIYINLSLAYYYRGKYDENLKYGLKAINLLDSLGDFRNLGTMYGELGYQMKRRDLAKSFELMRKGIAVLEEVGEIEPLAKIYDNYGVLHEMSNKLDSATLFYRKALAFKKQMNDSLGIPFSLNNIFSVKMLQNDYDSAKWYLDKSTYIREKRNDLLGLAENYEYYSQLFAIIGDLKMAIEYNQKALEIAKSNSYTFLKQVIYHDLAVNYEKINDYPKALQYHKLYKQYHDSLINLETNKTIADLQVQYETAEKEKELVIRNQQLMRERNIKTSIAIIAIILIVSIGVYSRNRLIINKRNEKIHVQNALIEGEQAERNRLALELHDGIANDLSSVILHLSNTNTSDDFKSKGLEKLRETHQSVRKLSHTLMPRSLREKGLGDALNELSVNFGSEKLKISVQILGMDERLSTFIEFNIYRIVQEALNNILKHSKASDVLIECNQVDGKLLVCIEDNGVGFCPDVVSEKGIGLQNITNRAKMMNGNVHIRSTPDEGTAIEVSVPIRE